MVQYQTILWPLQRVYPPRNGDLALKAYFLRAKVQTAIEIVRTKAKPTSASRHFHTGGSIEARDRPDTVTGVVKRDLLVANSCSHAAIATHKFNDFNPDGIFRIDSSNGTPFLSVGRRRALAETKRTWTHRIRRIHGVVATW